MNYVTEIGNINIAIQVNKGQQRDNHETLIIWTALSHEKTNFVIVIRVYLK